MAGNHDPVIGRPACTLILCGSAKEEPVAELATVAQLRYFLALVEHGSFAAAVYMAAPSLSD